MTTTRQRFLQTLNFEQADPPFVRAVGGWQETMDRWRAQGWDGRPLEQIFGTDPMIYMGITYGPCPTFEYELIEEDERTKTYINHEGIVMREFRDHPETSMPQFIRFPVENAGDFEKLAAGRLGLNVECRFSDEWKAGLASWEASNLPRRCAGDRWPGFFGPIRNFMGVENLCLAFYDQPALVERMMEQRADVMISITEEILRHTQFEVFWFWEDMACKHGPLIGPDLFRRFAYKHYRRVCDWLRNHGIKHIWLDSDGDIHSLIPIWLDAGINGLWPFEVQAGMDVIQIRETYGHDLVLAGGIDKRTVATGGDAMRSEVDRVMPLVEDGGYMPEIDHSAPPDITWTNYCAYMEYLMGRLGRG